MFEKFYSTSGMTVEDAKNIIRPYCGVISAQIKYLNSIDYFGGDWRSGSDTYGYESDEKILGNLCYISDRFNSAFRLRWTLDLVSL